MFIASGLYCLGTPLSVGSVYNFNVDAHPRLALFETLAKAKLGEAGALHGDETGINKLESKKWRRKYRQFLTQADVECPPPKTGPPEKKTRGRIARSKPRNLLERLGDYEEDVLRFMDNPLAPSTNNQGERDLRMVKAQQKISGCFRSIKGAESYCLIRRLFIDMQKAPGSCW